MKEENVFQMCSVLSDGCVDDPLRRNLRHVPADCYARAGGGGVDLASALGALQSEQVLAPWSPAAAVGVFLAFRDAEGQLLLEADDAVTFSVTVGRAPCGRANVTATLRDAYAGVSLSALGGAPLQVTAAGLSVTQTELSLRVFSAGGEEARRAGLPYAMLPGVGSASRLSADVSEAQFYLGAPLPDWGSLAKNKTDGCPN